MLGWSIFLFLVALFNAIVGFTGLAYMSSGMAIFAFFVFLAVSIVTLLMHLKAVRRRPPRGRREGH